MVPVSGSGSVPEPPCLLGTPPPIRDSEFWARLMSRGCRDSLRMDVNFSTLLGQALFVDARHAHETVRCIRKIRGVPARWGGPGSCYSHAQTAHSPSRAGNPFPLAPSQRGAVQEGGGVPAGRGVPARRGDRGPSSWCSSACAGSRGVGIPRAGSPQRAGTPRIFPMQRS